MLTFLAVASAAEPAPGSLADAEARGRAVVEVLPSQSAPPVLVAGATVMTAEGTILSPGWIWWKDGRIAGLGAMTDAAGLAKADQAVKDGRGRRVDAPGQFVTPGLIDTHSHLGVYPSPGGNADNDGNEMTAPTTPGVWAEHSVWPQDPGFQRAMAGGVTSMQILPGSANLIGGRGLVIHNVQARGSRAMRFPGAPETVKMACGENPKRVYGEKGGPQTRMGNLRGQREAFLGAEEYLREWQEYERKYDAWKGNSKDADKKRKKGGDAPKPPARDLDRETLAGVIEGRILPEVHCYRADDMLSFLQLAHEFGFKVKSFHHALEAYKIRDVLAKEEVAVSTWADWWGFKEEAFDGIPENAAMITRAGGRAVIHSDSDIGIQRLNQEAAKAMTSGNTAGFPITEDEALKWVTLNPAWAIGIDGEVGSLAVGKRADVVLWDKSPFSVYSSARLVFVDGALRFDQANPGLRSDFSTGQVP